MRYNKALVERAREFYSNVGYGNMEFNGFTVNPGWGMCSQLTRYVLDTYESEDYSNITKAISRFSKRWHLYSGSEDYPVPGGLAEYAYNSTEHTMYSGKYGAYRQELARYLYLKLVALTYSNATEVGLWAITQYKLRRVLTDVVTGKMHSKKLGLCYLMGEVTAHLPQSQRHALSVWKAACFESWPGFSGDAQYPVPSVDVNEDPMNAFMLCYDKYSGEYGNRRIQLALHLLDNLDF